jgi:hypothetical protein
MKRGGGFAPLQKILRMEGEKMVRINLLPEQEPKNWILLEKIIWVVGLALPFAIILWARLGVNSK